VKKNDLGQPIPYMAHPRYCELCKRGDNIIKKFIRHHVCYATEFGPEIIVDLCYGCHSRLHGTGKAWNSPFEKLYGKDLGPWEFAKSVCVMYERTWRKYVYGR